MADNYCEACSELTTNHPYLELDGLTDDMCLSLQNDTGLSASVDGDDCSDLELLNDCLIGSERAKLEIADFCDWKDFTDGLLGNVQTMFKAFGCSVCGLWSNVHALWEFAKSYRLTADGNDVVLTADDGEHGRVSLGDYADVLARLDEQCALIDQMMSPTLTAYGTRPLEGTTEHQCGTVTNKVYQQPNDGTLNPYTKSLQNVGIKYAQMTRQACATGETEMLEWILPDTFMYELVAGARANDLLWSITKSEAQSVMGMSDYLWQTYTESSFTWSETKLMTSHQMAWLQIGVGIHGLSNNEMGVFFRGCSAPNDAISSNETLAPINVQSARVYKHLI